MKLSDILDLIKHSASSEDWMRVDNESGDGGFTMVAVRDVLLCLSFNLVWKSQRAIYEAANDLRFDDNKLGRFVGNSLDEFKDYAQILAALKNLLEPLSERRQL